MKSFFISMCSRARKQLSFHFMAFSSFQEWREMNVLKNCVSPKIKHGRPKTLGIRVTTSFFCRQIKTSSAADVWKSPWIFRSKLKIYERRQSTFLCTHDYVLRALVWSWEINCHSMALLTLFSSPPISSAQGKISATYFSDQCWEKIPDLNSKLRSNEDERWRTKNRLLFDLHYTHNMGPLMQEEITKQQLHTLFIPKSGGHALQKMLEATK